MPDFRCTMLDVRGDVLFPVDIVAETQASAIRHARDIQRMSNATSSSSMPRGNPVSGFHREWTAQSIRSSGSAW
jgi:hypothetical protein